MTSEANGATKALQRRKLGRGLGALLNETRREEPLIAAPAVADALPSDAASAVVSPEV